MAAQGARNIVIFGTGSSVYFPEPPADVNNQPFSTQQRNDWADTYYQQTEQLLAPLAHSGVRIVLFDFAVLQARLHDNAGQYLGSFPNCEAGPSGVQPVQGVSYEVPNCFYENSVHPTGAGMQLVANYMTNQIDAPTTVVSQGAIAISLATNFTGSVFGRLDAYRTFDQFEMGAASATTEPQASQRRRWKTGGQSMAGPVIPAAAATSNFSPRATTTAPPAATSGSNIASIPSWTGAVFGYWAPNVDLGVLNAHDHIDSYQFAGYGSFTGLNWFADALVGYGRDQYALDRQGIIDVIHGATGADVFTAAAQAGYLADIGSFRAGPIAGLDYTHALIHAYTETGDELLTMMVGQQSVDDLIGDVGLELRSPFTWGGNFYSPFVNVTAEQDLLGAGRTVTTTQVTTPLLPVLTPVPSNNRVYGQVAAGVAASLGGNVSATLNAATTFAREGGNDFSPPVAFTMKLRRCPRLSLNVARWEQSVGRCWRGYSR